MKPGWRLREFECGHCHGANVAWNYNTEAPGDCCCNGGLEFIGPSGKLFAWPGGPFLGGYATPAELAESRLLGAST